MKILFLEPDPAIRSFWTNRLSSFDANISFISTDADWPSTNDRSQAAIALCRLRVDDSYPELSAGLLRHHARYVIAITPSSDAESHDQAFHSGFDDCIDTNVSDAELAAKFAHADHVHRLSARLAQAQKLESIGELAAGIAHEINTPIQYVGDNTRFVKEAYEDLESILATCQEIVTHVEAGENPSKSVVHLRESIQAADLSYLNQEIPSAIEQTLDGIDRVTNIVRAMKEFAHPGATEMTPTDLSKAIENTIVVARNEWKYVAEVETEYDERLSAVPTLPGEFNQVLLNIIVNASHAIAESAGGSPSPKGVIRIETRQADRFAEIRISDTGQGIDPENVDRIFKPFFTTKEAGKGTGQGLAIAHDVIVEKHSGEINVESEVGKGTTFTLRIPLSQNRDVEDTAASDDAPSPASLVS